MMKRKLKGKVVSLIAAVLLILISLFKVPRFITNAKLEKLGYSQEAIAAIYQKGLKNEILKNNYYSDYLNKEIVSDRFEKKYLRLYVVTDHLNEDSFYLYDRLKELKGYNDDELVTLFGGLSYDCLVPLCVFDKVEVDTYIADVSSHAGNGKKTFVVNNDYLHPYEEIVEQENVEDIGTYVSKKFSIGQYAPEKLSPISSMNAVPDCYLETRGLEAFNALCTAARNNGTPIYAVSAYKDYDTLQEIHSMYGGGAEADARVTRPGHSDAQLGLSVSVVASENESAPGFKDTAAYEWILKHAHEYGFIQRFPAGKESVTGNDAMENYFRYVGEELAAKIYESGLTFDEYYMLYIK